MSRVRLIHLHELLFDGTVCGRTIMPLSKMLVVKENVGAVTCRNCLVTQELRDRKTADRTQGGQP